MHQSFARIRHEAGFPANPGPSPFGPKGAVLLKSEVFLGDGCNVVPDRAAIEVLDEINIKDQVSDEVAGLICKRCSRALEKFRA